MKLLKKALLLLLVCAMLLPSLVACGKTDTPDNGDNPGGNVTPGKKYDSETTSLNFAIGLPDGVFHPMFSTSAYDSEIAGMTQISMLASDAYGSPSYGKDEPVVTLDMMQIMYDKDGNVTTVGSEAVYTTYLFLLKNGIKFSDGTPLTIKDVLFNMYTYLDPAYNGSATMYSVDIVGLAAYRTQNPNADKDYQEQLDNLIANRVEQRIDRFKDYYKALNEKDTATVENLKGYLTEILADRALVEKLFESELRTDYTSASDSVESAMEEYKFLYGGAAWEVFCRNEGLITCKVSGGKYVKEDYTTADGKTKKRYVLNDYSDLKEAMDDAVANKPAGMSDEDAMKECAISLAYDNYMTNANIGTVVTSWNTASFLRAELKVEEMSKEIGGSSTDGKKVKNISGITYDEHVTEFNGKTYADEHTVLSIKINKVDPKAIWDFAFTVSPMHYYSNEEQCNLWDGVEHFGVSFNDPKFRDNVLKDTAKLGLPVGAGAYKASNAPGTNKLDKTTFFKDNVIYFERNTYFETTRGNETTASAEDKVFNAKIKYLRYQVVSTDQMLSSLETGAIDFAEITATTKHREKIKANASLGESLQDNNGYGYVGINPRYVSDPVIRRVIMYAMDTSIIVNNYYTNGMGSVIYRPMSSNSWAYPTGATQYYKFDKQVLEQNIRDMIEDAGYTKDENGVYGKKDETGTWQSLKYTFTIAGETNDHPAYTMFAEAAALLKNVGMDITVKTDAQALSKLSNGSLAVWAAAWSSAIDPDLYQVYHKDSNATSVQNWGYSYILNDTDGKYNRPVELHNYTMKYVNVGSPVVTMKELIEELSKLIDLGRSTLDQDQRTAYYKDALDVIMEMSVELPTYQRKNLYAYNIEKIDTSTLTPESEITQYNGVISRIWAVDFR